MGEAFLRLGKVLVRRARGRLPVLCLGSLAESLPFWVSFLTPSPLRPVPAFLFLIPEEITLSRQSRIGARPVASPKARRIR